MPRTHPIPAETTPPAFDPADGTVVDVPLAACARNPASSGIIIDQDAAEQPIQPRRHSGPSKVNEPDDEFVEWWKPGWKGDVPRAVEIAEAGAAVLQG
jgi:hypothetical protein